MKKNQTDYAAAVNTIKEAILRSQYQAARLVNGEMLSLYYGIGRYISDNSRDGFWGTGAIMTISKHLRKELPGLKGFSETNIKNMRIFYEEWSPLFEQRNRKRKILSTPMDKIETGLLLLPKSSAMADDLNSSVATDDLQSFLCLGFTHHMIILHGEKDVSKRIKYIRLSLENRWNTRYLQQQIKDHVADNYGVMPSNFNLTIRDSKDAIKAIDMFKDDKEAA